MMKEKCESYRFKKNKQKLNWIRLAEHGCIASENVKYRNPHIKYNGIHWWITVGIECEDSTYLPSNDGVEIDLGIKDLAICSDKHEYKNMNKTQKVKKLEKRKGKLQSCISRRYEKNKEGVVYCKERSGICYSRNVKKSNE